MKKQRVIQIIREEIEKVVNGDKVTSTFNDILNNDLVDDRREYDIEDLESTYQLSNEDAKNLHIKIQKHIEDDLNERASAYKLKDSSSKPKSLSAINKLLKKSSSVKSGDEGYLKPHIVKSLEYLKSLLEDPKTKPEDIKVDFKVWADEQDKQVATWNNPTLRAVMDVGKKGGKDGELSPHFEPWKNVAVGRKTDPQTAIRAAAKAVAKAGRSGKSNDESGVDFSVLDKTVSSTKDSSQKDIDKGINKIRSKEKRGTKVKLDKGVKADKDSGKLLDAHQSKMRKLAKEYTAAKESGDKAKMDKLTSKLKDMTVKRKELQKSHEEISAGIGKDDELQAED
jgi:hypothetical protein